MIRRPPRSTLSSLSAASDVYKRQVGDPFDPQIHEALMHVQVPGYSVTTCTQVFQTGYLLGGRVIRPARVSVTDPTEEPAGTGRLHTRRSRFIDRLTNERRR